MKSPFLGLILPQTAKSSHHLVHFIQQDDWVLDANCFQCIQNSSWHGSYVSAPITRYQPKSPQFKEIRNQKKEGNGDEKVTTMSRYPRTHIQIVSLAAVFSCHHAMLLPTNLEEHCVTSLTMAARETIIQTPDALLN